MPFQQGNTVGSGFAQSSYDDPAFLPQADYSFGQAYGDQTRQIRDGEGAVEGDLLQADYKMRRGISDEPSQGGQLQRMNNSMQYPANVSRSGVDPSQIWGGMNEQMMGSFNDSMAPLPSSTQTEIVRNRGNSARQNFGQVTPPDGDTPENNPAIEAGKLDRSQRARNAANSRHAMSKKNAKPVKRNSVDKTEDPDNSDEEGDDDEKREKYRERNRVAAAKCRAKKKESVGGLEEKHREEQATNNFLKREVMKLRDELSDMRTQALRHDARDGRCQCDGIHQYNHKKAMELTMNHFGPGGSPQSNFSQQSMSNDMNDMGSPHQHGGPSQAFSNGQNFGFQQMQ